MYRKYFKRIFDFVLSTVLLVLMSPILFLLTMLLWLHFKRQPFFTQERPGFKESSLVIIKFKTMKDTRDDNGVLLPDKVRLTCLGKFIRKLSLDELPQLINVFMGDMSLIGPRPLLFKYLPLYSEEQRRRHEVRPGITGWAQINGRNSIEWDQKFSHDVYYVDNLSFILDLKIFWLTILKIFKQEGINQSADRPMQPFKGQS